MITNEKVSQIIMQHLADITGYDKLEISYTSSLVNDLGLDSMMIMDFHRLLLMDFPEIKTVDLEVVFQQEDTTVKDIALLVRQATGMDVDTGSRSIIEDFPEIHDFHQFLQTKKTVPYFRKSEGIASNKIIIDGQVLLNFSTYNYLGLNGDSEINETVMDAISRHGTSVSGSRLLCGEIGIHRELERKIADFIGTEDAIIQVGGHSTNVNTIGNIVNEEDLILHDALSHNSIIQGALLSRAKRKPFKHNDMQHLEEELKKLRTKFRRTLIIAEGVYSMDGDICNLPELIRLKEKYNAILMVDEAHSIGTIGRNGRGVTSHFGINPEKVDILMGTLSKSLNSCGGYIAGNKKFINYLKYNSPGFIFSVGMTPSNAAAALASLMICERDGYLFEQLKTNHTHFLEGLKKLGADTGESSRTPIIPLITRDSDKALEFAESLFQQGVNAMPIVYPAVKESEARIRFFISAAHTIEDLDASLEIIRKNMPILTSEKDILTINP
ncbi:aminotransferase class I/II-fold pyridoxal phosphate-dependent enzyme [Terribacillus sp. 179-K 1B1 HS]|uniref:aminotransferase class I/II-fold pyridoxal phosphate-dependent enzyme n=1 Tax=Terribacillus sp. 179-K 1B1 HS TaxID=3142388 RepID=UPI0039A17AF7